MSPAPCSSQKRVSSLISARSYSKERFSPSLGLWGRNRPLTTPSTTQAGCVRAHSEERGWLLRGDSMQASLQQSRIIQRKNPEGKKAITAFKSVLLKTTVFFFLCATGRVAVGDSAVFAYDQRLSHSLSRHFKPRSTISSPPTPTFPFLLGCLVTTGILTQLGCIGVV